MLNKFLSRILIVTTLLMPFGVAFEAIASSISNIEEKSQKPKTLDLAFNKGITIYLENEESIVKTIWLDNPTFAVLSFDGCVAGYGSCSESNAKLIHVKRIGDLKLENIPRADSTLMTVISENTETGKRDIHLFDIRKAGTSSGPLIAIAPVPQFKPAARSPISASGLAPEVLADKVTATLANPQVKQEVGRAERAKLEKFANLLILGTAEYQAMNLTGVSPELIKSIVDFKYGVQKNEDRS